MKRLALAVLVSVGLLGVGTAFAPQPAEATHTLRHLIRQVNQLEAKVANLQQQVRDLNHDVFDCQILIDPAEQLADGTFAHDLYYEAACAS